SSTSARWASRATATPGPATSSSTARRCSSAAWSTIIVKRPARSAGSSGSPTPWACASPWDSRAPEARKKEYGRQERHGLPEVLGGKARQDLALRKRAHVLRRLRRLGRTGAEAAHPRRLRQDLLRDRRLRPLQDRRGDPGGRREERRLRPLRRRAFRQERQRREPDAARHDDPPSQLRLAEDLAVPSKYSASPRVLMG